MRKQRKRKYRNKKVASNGLKFDSQKEARYYGYLLGLQNDGKIHGLKTQVKFDFNINGSLLRYVDSNRVLKYIADFEYFTSDGVRKVVDVKGFKTRDYLIKKALMMAVHNIIIEEI